VDKVFEPKMPRARAAELRGRWNEALHRAAGWEPKEKAARAKKSRRK
jgi:glycerol kinase